MSITEEQIAAAQSIQHEAARDATPQVRLVAGPGTGKSFAIEERVRWLLANGTDPAALYVVSFTRAASRDLKKRIDSYCASKGITDSSRVSVTTLHSLALRTLRAAGLLTYPVSPMVMDRWEQETIFDAEFATASGISPSRCADIRGEYEAFCSTGQWGATTQRPPDPPVSPAERTAFAAFHGPRTQTYACVLPGEIVHKCDEGIDAGTLDPVSRLGMQHLIVDEFQDLNPSDLGLIDHMVQAGVTTFVAGDDDQSIYSFRHASPAGIQNFVTQYPGSSSRELSACFRCTPAVVQTAGSLIAGHTAPGRIQKTLVSMYGESQPPLAGHVFRWRFPSGQQEARATAASCASLINAGTQPRDILLLLSNTRMLKRDITMALAAADVPYELPHANGYIDTQGGRFALSLLRVACNAEDYVALRTVLGLLPGVGIRTCNSVAELVLRNNLNYRDLFYHPLPAGVFNARQSRALMSTAAIAGQASQWVPDDPLSARGPELEQLLESTFGNSERDAWREATGPLPTGSTVQEARDFLWADTDEQQELLLTSVYQRLGLATPEEGVLPQKIRIMTMHGAKGLSSKIVFVPALEEEVLPGHWRQPYPGLVNEAARLLYVAVSRAHAMCVLTYACSRVVYGRVAFHAPSRFAQCLGGAFEPGPESGLTPAEAADIINTCQEL